MRRLIAYTIHCLALLLAVWAPAAAPQSGSAGEYAVKAAVVYKIAKFVTWPAGRFAEADAPMRFCAAADSPMFAALNELGERTIHGRPLRVLPVPGPEGTAEGCDVLYLGRLERSDARRWLGTVANRPVLTFGESRDLRSVPSIVTLAIRHSKVRFAINLWASDRAGLGVGAQLLQLASIVERREG